MYLYKVMDGHNYDHDNKMRMLNTLYLQAVM